MSEYNLVTLENGLKIITIPLQHLHSAEIAIYFKVGSIDDPADKTGISHFLEHMMFKGNSKYLSASDIDAAFEEIGGDVNAETSQESTSYYAQVHPDCVNEGLVLMSKLILTPKFKGFRNERKVIREEALEEINEFGVNVCPGYNSANLMWPDESLGQPVIGTLEGIASITREDIINHRNTFYTPDNAVLAISGKIDSDSVFKIAKKLFGNWKGKRTKPELTFSNSQEGLRMKFIPDTDSQVRVNMCWRSVPRGHKLNMDALIMRKMFAGGMSSRLFKNLREAQGFVYDVHSSADNFKNAGCLSVGFSTTTGKLPKATASILSEIQKLLSQGVTKEELERAKRYLVFDFNYSLDNTTQMIDKYAWAALTGRLKTIRDDIERIEKVTIDSISEVANMIFKMDTLSYVAVGHFRDKDKKATEDLLTKTQF